MSRLTGLRRFGTDQRRREGGEESVSTKTKITRLLLVAPLLAGLACSEPNDEEASLRRGVQLISTSFALDSVDMCWTVGGVDTLVRLDEEMLDAESTRLLDLDVEPGVRIAFVSRGGECSDEPVATVEMDSTLPVADEGAALLISGEGTTLDGTLVPVRHEPEELSTLRSTCTLGEAFASRTTRRGPGGSCWTIVSLSECQSVAVGDGQYANQLVEIYLSDWMDCREPVCPEITPE